MSKKAELQELKFKITKLTVDYRLESNSLIKSKIYRKLTLLQEKYNNLLNIVNSEDSI